MSRSKFLKHIARLEEEELREELKALYTRSKEVKNYYALELGEAKDRERIYKKAKANIASKYATKSFRKPRRPRIQKIKLLLNELKRSTVFPYEMIDVYLYNCECATDFMMNYHFQSTPLYNTIINSFQNAVELIKEENMLEENYERIEQILDNLSTYRYIDSELLYQLKMIIRDEMPTA